MVNIIGKRVNIQPIGAAAPDNGIGAVIAGLGQKMFGDTLTPELKRAKLIELQDQNDLRAAGIANIGANGLVSDPRLGSIAAAFGGMDMGNYLKSAGAQAAFTEGVDSPRLQQALAASGQFTTSPESQARTQAAQINIEQMKEAGRARTAEQGFQNNVVLKGIEEQNKRTLADANTEVAMVAGPDGVARPTIVRRADSIGLPSVVSSDQNKAMVQSKLLPDLPLPRQQDFAFGAQGSPDLYVGTTTNGTFPVIPVPGGGFKNAQTGEPITDPLSSVGKLSAGNVNDFSPTDKHVADIRDARIKTDNVLGQINMLKNLLNKEDAGAAVGALGKVGETLNYVRAQTEAAIKLANPQSLGYDKEVAAPEVAGTIDDYIRSNPAVMAKLQSLSIDAAVFRSQVQNLAYLINKANDDRGATSKGDVESAIQQIGGSLGDPKATIAVLDNLSQSIADRHGNLERVFRQTYPDLHGKIGEWQRQGGPPPAAGGVRRYNPTTGAIE